MRTLIKIVAVIAVIACVVSLFSACNSEEEDAGESDGIFCVTYKNVKIELGKSADGLINSLGNPISDVDAGNCGGAGSVHQYTYSGMTLNILTDSNKKSTVDQIVFTDDTVSTSKGIYVGKTADAVVSAYGQPTTKTDTKIEYKSGSYLLRFSITDGEVSKITYINIT